MRTLTNMLFQTIIKIGWIVAKINSRLFWFESDADVTKKQLDYQRGNIAENYGW